MNPDDPRHGTNAGHRAHYQPGGDHTPCDPCRAAHAEYKRQLWRRKYAARVNDLYIPSTGTARRIRALQAIGWRLTDIDAALGHGNGQPKGGPNYAHNLTTQKRVHVATAQKVARVYDALSMQMGPSARTRSVAYNKGWAPPLAWTNIDDPDDIPAGHHTARVLADVHIGDEYDHAVITRILGGDFTVPATTAERREIVARWPGTLAELERQTGWRTARYTTRDQEAS